MTRSAATSCRLERFGYEALALVPRDLDLETNRYQSCERYLF